MNNNKKGITCAKVREERKSLNLARIQTKILEEEYQNGLVEVDKVQKRRRVILNEIEEELSYQGELRAKLKFLKMEYNNLVRNQNEQERELINCQKNRGLIQKTVRKTEEKIVKIKNSVGRKIIHNNFPMLMEQVKEGHGFPKEKSILLNCLQDLIETTLANEFNGVDWKAKIANSNKAIGARICFHNLATQKSDIHEIYSPLIKGLAARFEKSNMSIQTKMDNVNGVVSKLDITIKVPLQIKQRHLELP